MKKSMNIARLLYIAFMLLVGRPDFKNAMQKKKKQPELSFSSKSSPPPPFFWGEGWGVGEERKDINSYSVLTSLGQVKS